MRPVNERRRYNVTSSLIDWTHIRNDPCICTYLYPQDSGYHKDHRHFCMLIATITWAAPAWHCTDSGVFYDDVLTWKCFLFLGESIDNLRIFLTEGHWCSSFMFSFVVILNALLNKQSSCRRYEAPWRSCDITVMYNLSLELSPRGIHHYSDVTMSAMAS